jgi:hypothetical protein
MRASRKRNAGLVAVMLAMALARCTGIETTNGVTVIASSSAIHGSAPAHVTVAVFDTAYTPFINRGISRFAVTDESGDFAFNDMPRGSYNVIVASPDKLDAAIVPSIKIDSSVIDSRYRATLEPVGSVNGLITNVPDTIPEVLIYLEGTGYYIRMPGNGPFAIDAIAAGNYKLRISKYLFIETKIDSMDNSIRNSVTVTVSPSAPSNTGTIRLQP